MGFVVVKRHATSKKSPASNLNLARTNEMDGHGQDVNVIDSIGAAIGSLFSQENRLCDDGVGSFMLTTLFLDAAACFPRSTKTTDTHTHTLRRRTCMWWSEGERYVSVSCYIRFRVWALGIRI